MLNIIKIMLKCYICIKFILNLDAIINVDNNIIKFIGNGYSGKFTPRKHPKVRDSSDRTSH